MPRCAAVKADSTPCDRVVPESQTYCYAHGPCHTDIRRQDATKDGGETAITEITLRRAKGALTVRSRKQGDGSWMWALPEGDRKLHTSQDDPLETLDPLPIDRPDSGKRGEKQGDHVDPPTRSGEFRINKPNSQNESEQDAKGDQGDHGSKTHARRLSAKEVQEIRKLVREGMSPEWVRAEVLGEPS